MIKSAKVAYLLSTCHKFASSLFTKVIQTHEKTHTACAKYYFDIKVKLDFSGYTDPALKQKVFEIKSIYNNFINTSNLSDYEHNLLEGLNTLTDQEKGQINKNYSELLKYDSPDSQQFEHHCKRHLYSLINLIRMYDNKYHYLFIPFTLDYSQDIGLVHQCGLLVNLKEGIFLFYEPYGMYIKYEHDYAYPIKKYLEIYKECLPSKFFDNTLENLKFNTYHEHFLQKREGIQGIILAANNARALDFKQQQLNIFTDEFKQTFSDLYKDIMEDIEEDTNPVNKTDSTIDVLAILDNFENYNPKEEKRQDFEKAWIKSLELYERYNSKTCVSITLIEMNALFSDIDLVEFYARYKTAEPNKVLMEDLATLLSSLKFNMSEKINETKPARALCYNITNL
jgi:hypothetical protein